MYDSVGGLANLLTLSCRNRRWSYLSTWFGWGPTLASELVHGKVLQMLKRGQHQVLFKSLPTLKDKWCCVTYSRHTFMWVRRQFQRGIAHPHTSKRGPEAAHKIIFIYSMIHYFCRCKRIYIIWVYIFKNMSDPWLVLFRKRQTFSFLRALPDH